MNKCFPKRKAWRKPLNGQQRRSQSVKKWFRPKHQLLWFCKWCLWVFPLLWQSTNICITSGVQNIRTVWTSSLHPESFVLEEDDVTGAILDLGDCKKVWQHNSLVFVACFLLSFELWVLKWNWNWKKGSRFNCYRVHGVWKGAEITIQTSFVMLEFDIFFPND